MWCIARPSGWLIIYSRLYIIYYIYILFSKDGQASTCCHHCKHDWQQGVNPHEVGNSDVGLIYILAHEVNREAVVDDVAYDTWDDIAGADIEQAEQDAHDDGKRNLCRIAMNDAKHSR